MKLFSIKIDDRQTTLLQAVMDHVIISEMEAAKLILQGSVWNNERNVRLKDKDKLLKNKSIIVVYPQYPIDEYALDPSSIKYEDDDMTIVYKEHGINTCPTPFSDIDCLSYGVQKHYNEKKIDYFVYTINRLDKPTGGLVFFAKNKKTEIILHNMFRDRKIKKFYICATERFDLEKDSFFIRDTLDWKGKLSEAATYIKFLKEQNSVFYFLAYPLTGRTHQIRKHFQKYIKPITGDCLYGEGFTRDDKLMLLCYAYKFCHPYTGKKIHVEYIPDNFGCK